LNPKALNVVKRSQIFTTLGYERMFFNVEQAVEAYLKTGVKEKTDTVTRRRGDTEKGRRKKGDTEKGR